MTNTLRLKVLLLTQGLKQKDMANYLGLSIQSANMKLNNRRAFKLCEIVKLCDWLKISEKDCFAIFFANQVDLRQQNV